MAASIAYMLKDYHSIPHAPIVTEKFGWMKKPVLRLAGVVIMTASLLVVPALPVFAETSREGITVRTYTGGCRYGVVDVNPQFRVTRGQGTIIIYAALYNINGQPIATSGDLVHEPFYASPTTWYTGTRWYQRVPSGGVRVVVFVKRDRRLVLYDHAPCRT